MADEEYILAPKQLDLGKKACGFWVLQDCMLPCRTKHGINVWKACPECKSVANAILHIEICIVKALVVESAYVIPSVCVHNNTQEQKTDKKWGRPGSIHHVNDVRWTLGGCRVGGGGVQAPKQCTCWTGLQTWNYSSWPLVSRSHVLSRTEIKWGRPGNEATYMYGSLPECMMPSWHALF